MEKQIQAIVTIVALVNPAMCMAIFSNCVGNIPKKDKVKEALKAITAIGIVLLISSIAGIKILNIFGISLYAFSCAGGGILIWIGTSMLKSAQDNFRGDIPSKGTTTKVSLSPLILFAASPGTITGVITVAASHGKLLFPVTAIIGVLVTLIILAIVIFISVGISKNQREVGLIKKMITSYMGVIVIAMGVQFIFTGIHDFLA